MIINRSNSVSSLNLKPRPQPGIPPQPEPQPLDEFRVDGWKLTKEIRCQALYQTMFETVQHLSCLGIPGCAGVAIAKAVAYTLSQGQGSGDERGQFSWQALGSLRMSSTQEVSSAARETFERVREMDSLPLQDRAIYEGLLRISHFEDWNISDRLP